MTNKLQGLQHSLLQTQLLQAPKPLSQLVAYTHLDQQPEDTKQQVQSLCSISSVTACDAAAHIRQLEGDPCASQSRNMLQNNELVQQSGTPPALQRFGQVHSHC